jgi:sugar phosphate isomerase/epimerase
MKLCFSTLACPEWSLEQMVRAAADNGIEGIDFRGIQNEIDITRLPEFNQDLDQTLSLLRRHGLHMPCLNTSVTLVCPAQERWNMMLAEAQRYADLAGRTGTSFLRIFGGSVPKEMSRDEARNLARRHLRQLVHICQPAGCQVLLETHDAWKSSGEVLELLGEFEKHEVGCLWDVEHPHRRGESPADTAAGLGGFLRHVHVKDSVQHDGKSLPVLMGEGELPLRPFVQALKRIGYDAWICLEAEKRWVAAGPDPEGSIPQFARYMRDVWQEPG